MCTPANIPTTIRTFCPALPLCQSLYIGQVHCGQTFLFFGSEIPIDYCHDYNRNGDRASQNFLFHLFAF